MALLPNLTGVAIVESPPLWVRATPRSYMIIKETDEEVLGASRGVREAIRTAKCLLRGGEW